MGRIFGYSRVSTSAQDWSMQVDALQKYGVDERDIFIEQASGAKRDREQLARVLDLLRSGDELVCWRLDRLARSQLHLLQIVEQVEAKGARLVSLNDRIDTSTSTGRMLVGMLAVLAEFERNLIQERTRAGVELARKRGARFGRPVRLTDAVVRQIGLAHEAGTPASETCRALGVSRSSYYNGLRAARAAPLADTAQAA